jgi:hypothetical protein
MKVVWHGTGFSKILPFEKTKSRIGVNGSRISFAFDLGNDHWCPFAIIYRDGAQYERTFFVPELIKMINHLFEGLSEKNQQNRGSNSK